MSREPVSMSSPEGRVAAFERHRRRLFGIAYRMLGTAADAEDVVQEAYLRWHQADAEALATPEAWLVTVTTRLAIDRLRRSAARRETYVGEWLPEPVATATLPPDHDTEAESDLSLAFLLMLERLGPDERAALLLREVLECDYAEIARILARSEVSARQLVSRAKARVRRRRRRFVIDPERQERLLTRFLSALAAGRQDELLALVASDATFVSDGGGKVAAALNPIHGADRIVRLLLGLERKFANVAEHRLASINGEPAFLTWAGNRIYCVTAIDADADRVHAFYRIVNPDKLAAVRAAFEDRR